MWLYNFFPLSLTILTFSINCMFAINGPKEELVGNIYLAKNLDHSQIQKKFFDILNSVLYGIDSSRTLITRRDIELKGTIVILKMNGNVKYENIPDEGTIDVNYLTRTQIMRLQQRKDTPSFGKDDRKIILVIMDNAKKRGTFARERQLNTKKKDNKKSKLRNTYADACIKVAVRKCFKALRTVNQIVCKLRYKCKSSLKSQFTKNSKVGCINEFDYSKGRNKTNSQKKLLSVEFRGFKDATREGYLDACIPYLVPNYSKKAGSALRNDTSGNKFANILRKSRSEEECQRLSQAKCIKACFFALKQGCAQFECSKRRIKVFSKACRHECRRAYQIIRSDSSDSSSYSY